MPNSECHDCRRSINTRSAHLCPDCHSYLCEECAQEHQGRCADCHQYFSQDN